MELVRGIAASAGLAVGTVRRLRHIQTGLGRVVMSPAQEFESFCAAAEIARAQLEEMEKKADSTQKDILGAQRMMLDDEGLREEIERYIKAGAGAAAAVHRIEPCPAVCDGKRRVRLQKLLQHALCARAL